LQSALANMLDPSLCSIAVFGWVPWLAGTKPRSLDATLSAKKSTSRPDITSERKKYGGILGQAESPGQASTVRRGSSSRLLLRSRSGRRHRWRHGVCLLFSLKWTWRGR